MSDYDVSKLPARPPLDGEFDSAPDSSAYQVGDLVAIFSRGCDRVAQIQKIGRSNLTCVYTTKGAWDSAQKIHAMYMDPNYVESRATQAQKVEPKNFDFYAREIGPDAQYERHASTVENYEAMVAEGKDAYVARRVKDVRQQAQGLVDEAIAGGVEIYVHVTTKVIKMSEVKGWKRS